MAYAVIMFALVLFLVCLVVTIAVGGLSMWSDFKGMTIPNLYSLITVGAFFLAYLGLWGTGNDAIVFQSFVSHLSAAAIMFVVTLLMFAAGAIGAGDSKLGTAFALWAGLQGLASYLLAMTLFGGILGIMALGLKKYKPFKSMPENSWVEQVQHGESKVPYGLAIVIGALASFSKIGYFEVSNFEAFLMF